MADDLLQGLKDAIGSDNPEAKNEGDPKDMVEQFLKALENMPGMSAEEKENLVKSISQGGLDGFGGTHSPIGGHVSNPWAEFVILFGLISLVILILGFIGYKLYYNMVERERRKELKKLQKDQKKKK